MTPPEPDNQKVYDIPREAYGKWSYRFFTWIENVLVITAIQIAVMLILSMFGPSWQPRIVLAFFGCNLVTLVFQCSWYPSLKLEVRRHRLVLYSKSKLKAMIYQAQGPKIQEGFHLTAFGFVRGLMVKNKLDRVFIPASLPKYNEIKAQVADW
jgi:hypothetical protein